MKSIPLFIGLILLAGCAEEPPSPSTTTETTRLEPPREAPGSVTDDAGRTSGPRVVFVGTSLTAGYGLARPTTMSWVGQVSALAADEGTPIEAVNAGVSGDTSAGGLRRIAAHLTVPTDAVVLELGANDGLRGLPVAALARNLASAIDTIRAHAPDAAIVVARMEAPPNLGAAYVESFSAVFDSLEARGDVRVTPFLLEGVAGIPALNQRDGIHPLPEGHRRLAETVWPTLREALTHASAGGG
ncbi:MAG: arylesterase [Longimicrobiales bacterium]|nr:arylesterase [Longimicrobiales bacterium]